MLPKRFNSTLFVNRERPIKGLKYFMKPDVPLAVLQIVGDSGMGKSWLVDQIRFELEEDPFEDIDAAVDDSSERDDSAKKPLLIIQVDFRHDRDAQAINTLRFLRLIRDRILYVGRDLDAQFHKVTQTINQFASTQSGTQSFFENISQAFRNDELSRFAQQHLNLDYDNEIEGANLRERVYNLIKYFERRNELDRMTAKLQQERPRINWDLGEQLRADSRTEQDFALRQINNAFTAALISLLSSDFSGILFLLDSIESAGQDVKNWLVEDFFPWLRRSPARSVTVLFTERPGENTIIPGARDILKDFKLEKLEDQYVIEYLQEKRKLNLTVERMNELLDEGQGPTDIRIPRIMHTRADELELEVSDAPDPFWDNL